MSSRRASVIIDGAVITDGTASTDSTEIADSTEITDGTAITDGAVSHDGGRRRHAAFILTALAGRTTGSNQAVADFPAGGGRHAG